MAAHPATMRVRGRPAAQRAVCPVLEGCQGAWLRLGASAGLCARCLLHRDRPQPGLTRVQFVSVQSEAGGQHRQAPFQACSMRTCRSSTAQARAVRLPRPEQAARRADRGGRGARRAPLHARICEPPEGERPRPAWHPAWPGAPACTRSSGRAPLLLAGTQSHCALVQGMNLPPCANLGTRGGGAGATVRYPCGSRVLCMLSGCRWLRQTLPCRTLGTPHTLPWCEHAEGGAVACRW